MLENRSSLHCVQSLRPPSFMPQGDSQGGQGGDAQEIWHNLPACPRHQEKDGGENGSGQRG